MSDYFAVYNSPFGKFLYTYTKKMILTSCKWIINNNEIPNNLVERKWPLFEERLKEYFEKKIYFFDFQFDLEGINDFSKKVLLEIQSIPFGKTITYSELALRVKKPNAQRVIGKICKNNRYPLVIPCHRVVAKKGYGGYCGDRKGELFKIKLKLLEHERS